ncbi:HMCN [Mytilus coruscus]|uniref:HMCN n=1 Tax=Mytilus coruscus TaxID=42192 RepID=A0A6J8DU96_MYTCO|nr:HMCN [Mytilus coruscus]
MGYEHTNYLYWNIKTDMWNLFFISTTLFICTRIADGQDDDDLRLVDGTHSREGRLEIFHSGIWGSVCDDSFHYPDASVACRQLGFRCLSDVQIYTQGGYTARIWMDEVGCNGLETSLKECAHNGWGSHNCGTGENVGIRCFGGCEGDLWLVGGSNNGRLNIYHIGSWGTVCNDAFGSEDALVVCKQLKMRTTNVQYYTAGNGNGTIWLDDVACNGQENRLDSCNHNGWSLHNCVHGEDVGVRCYGGYGSFEGDIRLVGGNNHEEGRLEIYHNSKWGTICDDQFDTLDAIVACRQLGYRTPTPTVYTSGGGTDPVWLDDMGCDGTERRIADCRHPGWGTENCGHNEDVGVRCTGEYVVNGNWGYWSTWSSCNSTCGPGTRKRTRRCDTPFPAFGGSSCTGDSKKSQTCAGSSCPVNGNWGSWSDWTICSSSCDSGYQTRSRLCNNPVPSLNGAYCNGKSFGVLNCSIARCSVDGSWGGWSMWSECNATCDGGVQKRTRYCNNPYPSAGGSACSGMADQILICAEINCPVIGAWSEWGVWSLCSTSCGSGNRTRSRLCDNPPPSYGGGYCNGNNLDLDTCNTHECPIDGDWGEWSSWDTCSATCNGGIQDRNRKCDAPLPSNGGLFCNGTTIESRSCNNENCEIDGQWSAWQEWQPCNATCGNGSKHRIRECDNPSPYFGGSQCIGLDFDIQTCYQDICPDAQLQVKEDTSNSVSSVLLGGVAVACIVVTAAMTCIALFVFRRFRPDKVATRKRNGCNTESLAELRVTSQQNDYDCVGRASGIQSGVYDTCRNTDSNVYANTQFTADNIETSAHANIPCNANNVEELYENLKIT